MKKIIFVAMVAIAMLASCGEKENVERINLVGNVFAEKVVADNGAVSYRVVYQQATKKFIPCSFDGSTFTKVEYDKELGLVKAYKKNLVFFFKDDHSFGSDEGYSKILPGKDGYTLVGADEQVSLYMPKTGYIFGPYREISVYADKLFVKSHIGWGLLDKEYRYLEDRVYDKLYIINQKSAKEYDVLKQKDGEWMMTTSDGASYDDESVREAVKVLKKKKVEGPIGVLDIKI